jgi:hypothetical protein
MIDAILATDRAAAMKGRRIIIIIVTGGVNAGSTTVAPRLSALPALAPCLAPRRSAVTALRPIGLRSRRLEKRSLTP